MTQLVLSYVKMCMLKIIIFLSPCSCLHYKNPTASTGTYIIAASDESKQHVMVASLEKKHMANDATAIIVA